MQNDRPYDRAAADPAFLERFAGAYRGRHDPLDALFWLQHPGAAAPSGAADPEAELRRVRVAVYRPDAREEDRCRAAALADALAADRAATAEALAAAQPPRPAPTPAAGLSATPAGSPAGARAPRPRPLRAMVVAGGAPAAAAVLVVAGVATTGSRPVPRPSPSERMPSVLGPSPVAYLGSAPSARHARADLAALVARSQSGRLTLFLAQHETALPGLYRAAGVAEAGVATGPHTFSLSGIERTITTGFATVLLTCSRPARYSWTMPSRGGRTEHVHGPECSGHIVATGVLLHRGHPPTALRVDVPRGVRVLVEVDLSRY